jgi:hypothetical protein
MGNMGPSSGGSGSEKGGSSSSQPDGFYPHPTALTRVVPDGSFLMADERIRLAPMGIGRRLDLQREECKVKEEM